MVAEWDWLRAGLLKVIAKTASNYRPEDVYLRARTGAAWIFAIDECGFVVLEQEHDCDGLVVVVWALWCEPGAARVRDGDIYAELERIGREAKAKRIRMLSPRRAGSGSGIGGK